MKYLLFLACLLSLPAAAAPGVMLKDEDLRASPSSSAASAGRLGKGAAVEILARQGGWTEVADAGRKGWVRILSVRSTAPAGAGEGLAGLVEAGTKRSDSGRVVAVAGLRGLNEEELKSARFDANQLMDLDRYQVNRVDAENYARAVGLRHRDLDYLPAPKPAETDKKRDGPWGEGGLL